MTKNVKRNHVHTHAIQSKPITTEHLGQIKARLDLSNPRHALFWVVATVTFYAMARLSEIVMPEQAHTDTAIKLWHLTVGKGKEGPYATIMLPTSKTHDPNIETTLAIWADGSDICPFVTLQAYLEFRMDKHYTSQSD